MFMLNTVFCKKNKLDLAADDTPSQIPRLCANVTLAHPYQVGKLCCRFGCIPSSGLGERVMGGRTEVLIHVSSSLSLKKLGNYKADMEMGRSKDISRKKNPFGINR